MSQYASNKIKEYCNRDTYVLRHGVDCNMFSFIDKPKRKPIFGMAYLSERKKRKGLGILQKLNEKGCNQRQKGGSGNIRSYEEMPEWYQGLDCLIVNSPTVGKQEGKEAGCMPILEAGAVGTTVFSTKVGYAQDVLDEKTGIIFDSEEEIIEECVKHQTNDKLKEMGIQLHNKIKSDWDWKNVVIKEWDNFFRRIESGEIRFNCTSS